MHMNIHRAADLLLGGGVIAYPTEGVFGLGCLPDDAAAVLRVLAIKGRDPGKGLILIADTATRLDGWIAMPITAIPKPNPDRPVTWIVPATPCVLPIVSGVHANIAVRITTHTVAAMLCSAAQSPLVSTSANLAGGRPARNRFVLRRKFAGLVDFIVPGDCGPATGPSEIRNLATGEILRPGRT